MIYEKKPIGRLVTLRQGFAINKNTKHHMSDEPAKLHLLRIGDMKNNDFQVYVKDTIPKRFIAKDDDIIYTRTGQVGLVFRNQYGVVHNNCFTVTSNDKNELFQSYLFYALQEKSFYEEALSRATGAAQPDLPHEAFKSIEIYLPPIKIQERIVQILDVYDRLIKNNQEQIKLLEEAAQRLYKEWFVDFRFPGYEDVDIVDGCPKNWSKKSILDNEIFKFAKSRVIPFDGEKHYYATADVVGTTLSTEGIMITFDNKPSRASVQPLENSVWFARMSNSYKILNCFGTSAHLANDSVISSGFAGFTSLEGCYGFVYQTIASDKFDEAKNRYATGATQVSLTNEGLKRIEVLIPTIDIVKQYSKIVEPFMKKAELLKQNCVLLQQSRDRLLPQLMSGEIEV